MPVWALALPLLLLGPSAEAQSFGDRLRSAVERTVEREVERRVVRETETITRCLMNDERCIDEARARGEDVQIVTPGSSAPRRGETIGGVEFPQGEISFADEVVSYTPGSPAPTAPHRNAQAALGRPQYDGRATCTSATDCTTLSLGSGGQLVVRFTDNVLTGSGDGEIDLWVFEVGPDVEDMAVEISTDGITWHSVGAIGGGRSGVDIDAFGFGRGSAFTHVRLTDDPNRGGRSGATPGADIDAVGAISTRATGSSGCGC